ncbi:MAG: M20/M25/M40 family metallo-hydrolase [Gemmatimonadota bacterium]
MIATLLLSAPCGVAQVASEAVDLDDVSRIRAEGLDNSQIEALGHHLTDVIGPRLTGSPGMRQANEWTAAKLREWGLSGVTVEPWGEFGRGWREISFAGRMVTPYPQPLTARAMAWTGSTDGTVRGPVIAFSVDDPDELLAQIEATKSSLAGAFVLATEPNVTGPDFEPDPLRTPLDELLEPRDDEPDLPRMTPEERQKRMAEWRARREKAQRVSAALADAGVAVRLLPSSRPYQLVRGGGDMAGRDPANPIPGPTLVVSQEHYAQMHRLVSGGTPVELEVSVQNEFFEDDLQGYNTLADLPGGDLADEYVMIGGHLDSWHYGTGGTDNAAGSLVMMEAMRILASLGETPRRTIRIALWGGEEQGLLGSRGWVEAHPELHAKISAYLNVDNGTGKIRGIWDQSNDQAIPIFEQILWPFRDLGVVAVKHGNTGGTDHLAFDAVGIPGFNFIQDPIEYGSRTHHTAADTYERLMMDDLRQAAVVVAATAWHLANRDGMVPRKPQGAAAE